jgi:PAS domain-containing protein
MRLLYLIWLIRTNYVSPSFTHLFGWDPDEINGGEIPFIPEDEKPGHDRMISR